MGRLNGTNDTSMDESINETMSNNPSTGSRRRMDSPISIMMNSSNHPHHHDHYNSNSSDNNKYVTNHHHDHHPNGGNSTTRTRMMMMELRTNKFYYFGIFCFAGFIASIVRIQYGIGRWPPSYSYNNFIQPYDIIENTTNNNNNELIDPTYQQQQQRISNDKKNEEEAKTSILARTAQPICRSSITTDEERQGNDESKCTIDFTITTTTDNSNNHPKPLALCYFVPYGKNFGDELGPAVVQKLVENYYPVSCQHRYTILNLAIQKHRVQNRPNYQCLFTLGSILHFVKPYDSIWGTGCNPFRQKIEVNNTVVPNITVYAARGPKTWFEYFNKANPNQVMITPPTSSLASSSTSSSTSKTNNYGDPGFLIPYLYPQYQKKKNITQSTTTKLVFCVIPHVQDLNVPIIQNITKLYPSTGARKVIKISPFNKWEVVVPQIQVCDYVLSSSLHGLIIADAIGIPNIWFQIPGLATARTEGLFKYQDYYTSILNIIKNQSNNDNDEDVEENEETDRDLVEEEKEEYEIIRQELQNRRPVPNIELIFNTSAYSKVLPESLRWKYVHNLIESFPYHLFERQCDST